MFEGGVPLLSNASTKMARISRIHHYIPHFMDGRHAGIEHKT